MSLVSDVLEHRLRQLFPVVYRSALAIMLELCMEFLWKVLVLIAKTPRCTAKYILHIAVILRGFRMSVESLIQVGRQSLVVILLTLSAGFLTAALVGRSLRVGKKLSTLIGVGTGICGASAIAAASSAIDAEDQDISYSISTVFLFNVLAVFLFPLLGRLLDMTSAGFGMWAGTAINDTSSVVAAGYSYSEAAGDFATIVKLTRSLMIVPVTLAIALLYARKGNRANSFSPAKVFPWFIVGFVAAAVLRSAALIPDELAVSLAEIGKFLIITAMAAIGLNSSVRMFAKTGPRAILVGAATWLVVLVSSLAVQHYIQIW